MTEVKTRNSSMPELEAEQEVDFARYGRADRQPVVAPRSRARCGRDHR
jgi:hypothetical protein